ncbi:phosphoesterase PA-phosphatase related [Anaeromyxobacter dehalogenans 2CP-1]|uniref:Phosphoesterase PA-phosphatase related n=1 Tax=Anaeromyxobacter dehalogenans (strain ATCC BAA-258 / DSM 21875 / 2CP-1) TaxID=455488 RepID=B8JBZ4_ANAD2|nr:phosphatase PAP2 family protein [Anaeromyxobacter dehalogenans]ACL63916.1 phosphoesterase PA-phosphatase related [Anaeromyxobacter dehalogenans 2CP-1]
MLAAITHDLHTAGEAWLFRALNADGGPILDGLMVVLSSKPFGAAWAILLAVLIARAVRGPARLRLVAALGAAIAMSDGLGSQLLRPLLARRRPCYALPPGTFRWLAPAADVGSLPSLHAANFFAMATVAAAAGPRLGLAALGVAVLVALSRVYVGVHWPTDVLAGAAWGVVCGMVARLLATRLWAARQRRRAAPPPPVP